jgi:hypothetical protein
LLLSFVSERTLSMDDPAIGAGNRMAGGAAQAGGQILGSAAAGTINTIQEALRDPRPFGVTVLASWIGFLGGLYTFLLLASLCGLNMLSTLLQQVGEYTAPGAPGYSPYSPSPASLIPQINVGGALLYLVFITALAGAHIAFARGLFQLKTWAYWAVVGLEGLNILIALITLVVSKNGLGFLTTIFLPALTLIYMLSLPGVRKSFQVPF